MTSALGAAGAAMILPTLAAALGFAAIHIAVVRTHFLDRRPRAGFLSFAGGIAVTYVFLDILPQLAAHQRTFARELRLSDAAAEAWVYLVALIGLVLFYGLERAAKLSRAHHRHLHGEDRLSREVRAAHLVSFAFFNFLVGYLLLHREQPGFVSLGLYVSAIALHLAVTDLGLVQDHKEDYRRHTRWVLSGAVLAGWAAGVLIEVRPIVIGFLFAFLGGGVILNVLKEELPEERRSRFQPFLAGCAVYAGLVLAAR